MAWTETRQAKWLTRRIITDLKHELELVAYFHTVDLLRYNWGAGPTDFDQSMGLLRGTDYSPKPSYFAYQCLCTLFDGQTRRDCGPSATGDPPGREPLEIAVFSRGGHLLMAYWEPADLFEPFATRRVSIRLTLTPDHALSEPVLVDPIAQEVFRLPIVSRAGQQVVLAELPLRDYPLLVTDRRAVPIRR